MGKNKDPMIGFHIDGDLKKRLKALADAEGRTLANYLRRVMLDHIKELNTPGAEEKQGHR